MNESANVDLGVPVAIFLIVEADTAVARCFDECSVAICVEWEWPDRKQLAFSFGMTCVEPAHLVVVSGDTLPRTKHAAPRHVCSSDLFSDITFRDRCTVIDLMFCNSVECR